MSHLSTKQRWILLAASLAVGLAFLDETAVVTALRTIQSAFGASSSEVQWVMGAYLLSLASLMAAAGRLADLYGRRRLFLVGAGLFGAGSIACAAAPTEELLIAARALQGSGAALLMPLGLAHATAALPEEQRGWAIGIVSTGGTVFLALGPLIGGGVVELAGWRWIFLINVVPIAAISAIALRSFPETKAAVQEPLDVKGLALVVSGLVSVVLALLNMQDWGPSAPVTLVLLIGGVALLMGFVAIERRVPHPLIGLQMLRIPAVTGSLCALFAIQFAILGLTVYLTLYLQLGLGYSPAVAGALTLPTVVLAPLLSTSVGRLTDRVGTRTLTAGSMLLAAAALATIWLLANHREALLLMPAFVAFGIARPIATIAGAAATIGATPLEARGLSSGLATQARQLGAVLGVAVLGLVLTGLEISRRNQLLRGIDASFGHRRREALDGILAGSARANQLLHALSPSKQHAVREAATSAFVSGFQGAMIVTALLAASAALASWLLLGQPAGAGVSELIHRRRVGLIVIANAIRRRND
jgi:EmrB/QacA subfamily drug resistance transporter